MKNSTLLTLATLALFAATFVQADIPCKNYCSSLLSHEICEDDLDVEACEREFMENCMETCDQFTSDPGLCDMEDLNVLIPTRGRKLLTCNCGTGIVTLCRRRCPVSVIQRAICTTACVLRGNGRPTSFTCATDNSGTCK